MGYAEHQVNYYTQVKNFEFYELRCKAKSERNEFINIKSCNLLDSLGRSSLTLSLHLIMTLSSVFKVRAKQVLVTVDHKRWYSADLVEALLSLILKNTKISLHIQGYFGLNLSECPVVRKNKICALYIIRKELKFIETIL